MILKEDEVEPEAARHAIVQAVRLLGAVAERARAILASGCSKADERGLPTEEQIEAFVCALWLDDGPEVAREIARAYINGDNARVDAYFRERHVRHIGVSTNGH